MRRWFKWLGLLTASVLVALGSASWWALTQTRHVPEFYSRAANELPEQQTQAASQRLQADVERLKSDASQLGSWSAVFSDDEVNAWLVEELPKTLPRLLAGGARQPRIVIEEGKILAAARFTNRRIDTVISCELMVELTEQPNMLALRVANLRAGALPLPLNRFLKGITKELAKGDIDVQWDFTDAGPVALVTVPSDHPRYARTPVIVESVKLRDGSIWLSGNTGSSARQAYDPRGPVHRFVSYRHGENRSRQTARLIPRGKSKKHLR